MDSRGLIIHHNIFLTREQRYALHYGQDIDVVGVSVPVWCRGKVTSEPGREVFCQYRLRNLGEDHPVTVHKQGYQICVPNRAPVVSHISDDTWRLMDPEDRHEFYSVFRDGASTRNLLDIKDGGSESLMYREHTKVRYANDDGPVSIIHLIQIRAIERLEKSIFMKAGWEGSLEGSSKAEG